MSMVVLTSPARISLRHAAFRVLSASRSTPSLTCRSRSIHNAVSLTVRSRPQRSIISQLQRRYASEEAQTQSEPVADGATEAQHGENSIAAASQEQSQPTEPAQEQKQKHTTLGEVASSATEKIQESASTAYNAMTGGAEGGAPLTDQQREAKVPKASVYVGNLYFDIKERDLQREFEKCGPIESVRLILDNRGLSKGFGYINFTNNDSAARAIRDMNQQPLEGRRLTVQYAAARGGPAADRNRLRGTASEPSRTLFIGNMAFDMSDRELNQLFREIRNVIDVRVAIDRRTGQPRGFAHADFTDMESAKEAMAVLAGKEVCGRPLRVDYSQSTGRAASMQANPQSGS